MSVAIPCFAGLARNKGGFYAARRDAEQRQRAGRIKAMSGASLSLLCVVRSLSCLLSTAAFGEGRLSHILQDADYEAHCTELITTVLALTKTPVAPTMARILTEEALT